MFVGTNKIVLNQATMKVAVKEYLDKRTLSSPLEVLSVDGEDGKDISDFEIIVAGPIPKEGA